VAEQVEGALPLLTAAVERFGALVDAHGQADAVLKILVDEGNAIANAEVGMVGDLGRQCGLVEISRG